jgi:hypothetical protein
MLTKAQSRKILALHRKARLYHAHTQRAARVRDAYILRLLAEGATQVEIAEVLAVRPQRVAAMAASERARGGGSGQP